MLIKVPPDAGPSIGVKDVIFGSCSIITIIYSKCICFPLQNTSINNSAITVTNGHEVWEVLYIGVNFP